MQDKVKDYIQGINCSNFATKGQKWHPITSFALVRNKSTIPGNIMQWKEELMLDNTMT